MGVGFLSFSNKIKIRLVHELMAFTAGYFFLLFTAIYSAQYFGVKVAGMILIVYSLIGIISNLLSGYYADRVGRKTMLLIAEVLRTAAVIVLIFCNSPSLTLPGVSVAMFIVLRASTGFYRPPAQAMIIDISTPEEREGAYRAMYWVRNVSMALGATIGGLTFEDYLFGTLNGILVLSLTTNIMLLFFVSETLKQKTTGKENVFAGLFKSYKEVMADRLFIVFVAAIMLVITLEILMDSYIAIRMSNMSAQTLFSNQFTGVEIYGILNVENTILTIVLTWWSGRVVAGLKGSQYFVIAMFLYILGYAVISYANNAWIIFLFAAVSVIGEIIFGPKYEDLLSNLPPEGKVSSYMAFNNLSMYVAMLLGSFYVTLSSFFNNLTMSGIIFMTGLTGILMIVVMLPKLNARRNAAIEDSKLEKASV